MSVRICLLSVVLLEINNNYTVKLHCLHVKYSFILSTFTVTQEAILNTTYWKRLYKHFVLALNTNPSWKRKLLAPLRSRTLETHAREYQKQILPVDRHFNILTKHLNQKKTVSLYSVYTIILLVWFV